MENLFYTDKMPEIVEMLEKSGKLIESQGAKVVDLEEKKYATMHNNKIKQINNI